MTVERQAPCKINLLLNILRRRPDNFHELETVMHPLPLHDTLRFSLARCGVELDTNVPGLPVDERNLVVRAANAFLAAARIQAGLRINLEKRVPLAAGLGGGSSDAAMTLDALNQLFDHPLSPEEVRALAAGLGSDVPFFLQRHPAIATGRGEQIEPITDPLRALGGKCALLVYPGFGVPTAWA